jgi:hypothetical protein
MKKDITTTIYFIQILFILPAWSDQSNVYFWDQEEGHWYALYLILHSDFFQRFLTIEICGSLGATMLTF